MTKARNFLLILGGNAILMRQIARDLLRGRFYLRLFIEQIYHVGLKSFPLIFVVSASVGMVMALQFGIGLEKFGGKPYVPKLVVLSLLRELGPVFTALMLAARVGAGFTSEIGSMVVTQQVDAYRALGSSPIKIIVIPRVLACLLALPLLTALANGIGLAGGLLIGTSDLGLDITYFWQRAIASVNLPDYFSGFCKTFFFALFIAVPSCHFGLCVRGGTRNVGVATTKAVVVSSILILAGDFVLTKLFLVFEKWN